MPYHAPHPDLPPSDDQPKGIEVELRFYIDIIREHFPDATILTEKAVQDVPGEVWYLEESRVEVEREQPETFIERSTYSLYFIPDTKNIKGVQSRLRCVRRWVECNFILYPLITDFTLTQTEDMLTVSFKLWRHYRLIPDKPVMMNKFKCSISAVKQNT